MTAEQCIAYEGDVELRSWSDTSAAGAKAKFILNGGRDELIHFEAATKRRGRRGGQRYNVSLSCDGVTDTWEAWFCGANWAHQDGATITLAISEDTLYGTIKQIGIGDPAYMVLVQIDDNEMPVNQVHAVVNDLKGGPLSKHCAMLCQDPAFQEFAHHLAVEFKIGINRDELADTSAFTITDHLVKRAVGISSKRQLDHEPAAAQRYQDRVVRRFLRWANTQ